MYAVLSRQARPIGLFLKAAEREDVQKKLTQIVRAAKQAEGDPDWARAEAMIPSLSEPTMDPQFAQTLLLPWSPPPIRNLRFRPPTPKWVVYQSEG